VDRLNNAQTFLTQEQTQLTEAESNSLDVDMGTAVTDLTQTDITHQALVQAGGQISQLNLFDYLPTP
jgi:flagellin-like hook-associated protein FlgL